MAIQVQRIILEPTETDPTKFTLRVEWPEDDVQGHELPKPGQLELEPLDDEDQPTYRIRIDDDDVEGHRAYYKSDRDLKTDIRTVEWDR